MFIKCNEMIFSPNEDFTYKVELTRCQFSNNGEIIEGTITFPRVYRRQKRSFEFLPVKENSEIFTLYIPE